MYEEETKRIIIADSRRIEIFLYARQLNDLPWYIVGGFIVSRWYKTFRV